MGDMRSRFLGNDAASRRRSAAILATIASTALLAACASTPEPEPTTDPVQPVPTETTAPTPSGPVDLIVPKVCEAAFSIDQEDGFYDKGLVLNPDFLANPDTPVVPEEIRSTVESWNPLVCTWTLPMASDYAIVVSFAKVDEASTHGTIITLEDLGFARSDAFDGTRLTLNVFADQDEAGFPSSDAHYFGRGIWVGVYSGEPNEAQAVLNDTIQYLIDES